MSEGRLLYPLMEAAHLIGVGRSSLYAAIGRGDLLIVKVGRRSLIPADSIQAYIEKITREATEPMEIGSDA